MRNNLKYIIGVAVLTALPHLSFGQYFQRLYDVDSSWDWGWNILLQPDGNYFIRGTFQPAARDNWALFNMQITAEGNTVLSKNILEFDAANMYLGTPGETRYLPGEGYVAPIQISQPSGIYPSGRAGLIKYNTAGDTVFLKTYTDTTTYFEFMDACAVMPDGGYLGGGGRSLNLDTSSYYKPLLLIRTDTLGDTLWTHTYQKNDTQMSYVINLISLADGRIAVGATSTYQVFMAPLFTVNYSYNVPWFLLLDSMGNILRDTAYTNTYMVGSNICGNLYPDMNGGYIHIGVLNIYDGSDPYGDENFPSYIAHLDTNFRITWITNFTYNTTYGNQGGDVVRQLRDSSYLVVGEATGPYAPSTQGFAAKVSKTGTILWRNNYYSDTTQFAYFIDAVENPDGSLVFIGKTFNDTCAAWKDGGDVWLVGTDSNGYVPPDSTTGVATSPSASSGQAVTVWPNPTSGSFMVMVHSIADEPAQITVSNMVGEKVKEMAGTTNKATEITLNEPPGVYFVCATTAQGNYVVKVVVK